MKDQIKGDYRITVNGKKRSKVDFYKWDKVGKPGEFQWIDKEDLVVDHNYQREKLNEARISGFSAHWCWVKCGVLSVAIRNNEWFVIDGQHRKLAADKRSDIKKLPCMIFELDGIPKEARAFVDINSEKTAIQSFDKFRALIVGNDETAIGLNELFKTTGHYAANTSAVKAVQCLMTTWRIYKKDKQMLIYLWPLISDIHTDCQIRHEVIEALYYAEQMARKVKRTLTENDTKIYLIKIGGQTISAEIKKEVTIVGAGGYRIVTNALIKLINKQRLSGKTKIPLID